MSPCAPLPLLLNGSAVSTRPGQSSGRRPCTGPRPRRGQLPRGVLVTGAPSDLGTGNAIAGGGHSLALQHRAPAYTQGFRDAVTILILIRGDGDTTKGGEMASTSENKAPSLSLPTSRSRGPCCPFAQTDPAAVEPRAAEDPRRQRHGRHHTTDGPSPTASAAPVPNGRPQARRNHTELGAGGVQRPVTVTARTFPRCLRAVGGRTQVPSRRLWAGSTVKHGDLTPPGQAPMCTGTSHLPGRPPCDRLGRS